MTTDPRWIDEHGHEIDEDHRGLVYDIRTLVDRRRALGLFGGIGVTALLAACASPEPGGGASAATTATPSPEREPDGVGRGIRPARRGARRDRRPLPGRRVERRERARRLGHRAQRHPLELRLVEHGRRRACRSPSPSRCGMPRRAAHSSARASTSGTAIATGNYSLYSRGVEGENYLRGVQETDATGTVRFTSIYPACYSGRWPHIHFEVYSDVANAVASGPIVKTSQLALPEEVNDLVYATSGYEQSVRNLAQTSLARDNVFGDDGGIHQIASMSGSVAGGYTAALTIGV